MYSYSKFSFEELFDQHQPTFSCRVRAGATVLCLNSTGNRLIAAGQQSMRI
jgi:hypothetical protein